MNHAVENNFSYHPPKDGQPEKYERIRNEAKKLAYVIDELCPSSHDKNMAMDRLQETVMWANKAIACNE